MNLAFLLRDKKREYEYKIATALKKGSKAVGYNIDILPMESPNWDLYDGTILFGCANPVPELFRKTQALNKLVFYIDKGYIRGYDYKNNLISRFWRISANGFQPHKYFDKINRSSDRFDSLKIRFEQYKIGDNIIYAGANPKYNNFHGLTSVTEYAQSIVDEVKKYTNRPIIYSIKPNSKHGSSIRGAKFLPVPIDKLLKDAYTVITYGSNASVDAVWKGIPVIILGDGIAKTLGLSSISEINSPKIPTTEEKYKWGTQMAYCKWTYEEMNDGIFWTDFETHIKRLL